MLGLAEKRYGDELLHVRLASDAVIVRLDPARTPAFEARDLTGNVVPIASLVADPTRIAAIFHVRTGTDVPAPFREMVLVNEARIDAYGAGTATVHAEADAESTLLRDLLKIADLPRSRSPARSARSRAVRLLSGPSAASSLVDRWDLTLAFTIPRYELDSHHVREIEEALAGFHADVRPVESERADAFADE